MKLFGYSINSADDDGPLELREVSLLLSIEEIEVLAAFARDAKARFTSCSPTSGQSHVHLRDTPEGRNASGPDLVIVYRDAEEPPAQGPPPNLMDGNLSGGDGFHAGL